MVKGRRSCQDQWEASPAKVTSRFRLSFTSSSSSSASSSSSPTSSSSSSTSSSSSSTYNSPICGFGWRLKYTINTEKATLGLSWDPHLCYRLGLGEITVSVQILDTGSSQKYQNSRKGLRMSDGVKRLCSGYTVTQKRPIEIVLSLLFDSSIGLSFPSSPPRANVFLLEFLDASLTRPSPVDTKLYLYSARKGHQATRPKSLFVSSNTLRNSAFYWETMFSGSGFERGVQGDLFVDDPEVIQKLSSDQYDYNSDSDLESISDETDVGFEDKAMVKSGGHSVNEDTEKPEAHPISQAQELQDVKAAGFSYAINGTAHRTLKAYIAYVYTGEIKFNSLRSTRRSSQPRKKRIEDISCSPKSMYRLADFIGIPVLKAKAKIGIEQGLTKENIVTELFSCFTSKYDEIIELETDFLINNFSDEVELAFNAVLSRKEYHSRTLILVFKMLQGNVKTVREMAN